MEEKAKSIQDSFLKRIKSTMPSNLSMVDELADLLGVSNDSAYRRIRCETPLDISEIAILCEKYKVSFDADIRPYSGKVSFDFNILTSEESSFKQYLHILLADLKKIGAAKDKQVIYAADDVPIFHHFIKDEIISFKIFYWLKSILNVAKYDGKKFDKELIDTELIEIAKNILKEYNHIPSVELWTEDTLNSTLKQVEYYWESGFFKTKEEALIICEQIGEVIDTLQHKAEKSSKLNNGTENFTFYKSEIMIGNNTILATVGDNKLAYISHHTFNMMTTTNTSFIEENEAWLKNLMKRSILISGVSEKQRNQFFKVLHDKLSFLKSSIK
jgi:hypothetical protein